ncbi:MAG: hypothetical protein A2840_02810 [Candidatus Buchananbacteria bacterium RIFCSPHIGHO2_01_FULL_47_11b]|uniref:NIF system FeS cluster assembly NifU N-terminal domain-containing protein n=1 Tax=Candidatus Buchananbacteria bacterium RIFCSPHIGHO2_01_FULL_47_11b TaxID=1797537 RepID=A0A1G1Y330_9BACT|nr:MAG: hypothetical protein A2840_02810 [Candidatus Buchananbacteria bacterium RIFCSPHIGHO2_01_FULL_47_11b]
MATLYSQKIMRHYRQASNRGMVLKKARHFTGANPYCGDTITLQVRTSRVGKITQVHWQASGCVISQAAASVFSEMLIGKTINQAQKIKPALLLKKLDGALSPNRISCALLPLFTLRQDSNQ